MSVTLPGASAKQSVGRERAAAASARRRSGAMLRTSDRSRSAMVRAKEPTESLTALDPTDGHRLGRTINQPIAQALD